MKKNLLLLSLFGTLGFVNAQNINVFNNVTFYSMYHYLGENEQLPAEAYQNIPEGAIRIHQYEREIISRKLTENELASLQDNLTVKATIKAACDNYDRLAGVNLALVPKGRTTYTFEDQDVKRIEIGRIITPFMNKNYSPTEVPYTFRVDQLAKIFKDNEIKNSYDFWIEFRADGYSAAANQQVAGCANRTDVFKGDLVIESSGGRTDNTSKPTFIPLSYRNNLNNYNATDVTGETTRIVNFTIDENIQNAKLILSTSNHGANSGGEEYVRREHFIYLNDQLIHQYKPGGNTCEPFRQFNTQGNGIYGASAKTLRNWLSWNNWCPADKIPNREIDLGNLSAGTHSIKIDVPDAEFVNNEGYFPISMYIVNSASNETVCKLPSNLNITDHQGRKLTLNWTENGNSTNWEVLAGRKSSTASNFDTFHLVEGNPSKTLENLIVSYNQYEFYVRSICDDTNKSEWAGPIYSDRITLNTTELDEKQFKIFPNPTTDILNIDSKIDVKDIEIYALDGKIIWKGNSNTIDFKSYNKGTYVVKVLFIDGTSTEQKIIKK